MLLLPYNPKETLIFNSIIYTYERIRTRGECYRMDILRKREAEILIHINYQKETITINKKEFTTSTNHKYLYRKARGNHIEVSDFNIFIDYLKESSNRKDVFYHRTEAFLLTLTRGRYSKIHNQ